VRLLSLFFSSFQKIPCNFTLDFGSWFCLVVLRSTTQRHLHLCYFHDKGEKEWYLCYGRNWIAHNSVQWLGESISCLRDLCNLLTNIFCPVSMLVVQIIIIAGYRSFLKFKTINYPAMNVKKISSWYVHAIVSKLFFCL
jgi:hypothetical protein